MLRKILPYVYIFLLYSVLPLEGGAGEQLFEAHTIPERFLMSEETQNRK